MISKLRSTLLFLCLEPWELKFEEMKLVKFLNQCRRDWPVSKSLSSAWQIPLIVASSYPEQVIMQPSDEKFTLAG